MDRVAVKDNKSEGTLAHYEFPFLDPPYSINEPTWKDSGAVPLLTYDLIIWFVADEVLEVAQEVFERKVIPCDITPEVFEEQLVKRLEQRGWEIEVHQPSIHTTSVYYALGRKS